MPPNQHTGNDRQSLKIALIGQSAFAVDVFHRLRQHGHHIVAIFTIPDKGKREDPLAKIAQEHDVPLFKIKSWRKSGKILPEIYDLYRTINIDLNVLPYCSQFIPMEVINHPPLKTICYHPSLLPRHRGASSINWTLICGDKKAGLSIFWADDGLDTGPILLQEECDVYENDTVDTLYKRFLYPNGVVAIARAVDLVANNKAPRIVQDEKYATYDPILINKPDLQQINFNQNGMDIHNFIRGMDSVPGASCKIKLRDDIKDVQLFGSSIWKELQKPKGDVIEILTNTGNITGILCKDGLLITGKDNVSICVKHVKLNGRMKLAKDLLKIDDNQQLQFTNDELDLIENFRKIWENILNTDIDNDCDFFANGGGSMDVVRLIEEIKELTSFEELTNEDLFMAPIFDEFSGNVIKKLRNSGDNASKEVNFRGVELDVNKLHLRIPTQLFINGEFVDAENSKTLPIVNPHDESIICHVQCSSANDVNKAVAAAKDAFESGEWSRISARERGQLLYKLADLMHQHKEELATIESIDSGAVYTLALKTHIGMSIETWRYFAGWCDKIHGTTIPISHARPNRNLTFTKKEPLGVCGLITPWNYPLMMLSWKMAACLAAGNTVIIKPAQVCPLTALKFAELSVKAGIPPGVINIVPGTGRVTGDAILTHPDIRKVGFTGSTEIGKTVMKQCAEINLKKCSLELGGKSPLIICSDCDLDKAVRVGMQSVFFNKGENCIAAGRLFVEDSIHDEFVRRCVQETRKLQIGDPLNRSTAHGPQNHLQHFNKLLEFIETGCSEGARLEYGGKRLDRPGFYLQPTIFTNVEDHMFIAKEESFGPIMIISRFSNGDLEGVLKRANATEYGLASGIFTKDISKALQVAERIDAGTVFINTYNKTDVAAPFGGFKQSGFGKDLGQEALNEYLKTKCVTIEY